MSCKVGALETKALPILTLERDVKELGQSGRLFWSYIYEYIAIYRFEQNSGNFEKLSHLNSLCN